MSCVVWQVYHQHPGATAIVQRLGRIMVSLQLFTHEHLGQRYFQPPGSATAQGAVRDPLYISEPC